MARRSVGRSNLASHMLFAQHAAIGPAPVVAPPQQGMAPQSTRSHPLSYPRGITPAAFAAATPGIRASDTRRRVQPGLTHEPQTEPVRAILAQTYGSQDWPEAAAQLHQLSPTERLCGGWKSTRWPTSMSGWRAPESAVRSIPPRGLRRRQPAQCRRMVVPGRWILACAE